MSLPLVALAGPGVPWPLLLLAVALGAVADRLARTLAPGRQPLALVAGAIAAGLLLPAFALGGPLRALAALLPGDPGFLVAYGLLLLGLFLYWRGSRIDTRDGEGVGTLFQRGTLVGVAALIVGALVGSGAPAGAPIMLAHIVGLIALGLLALALAHAQDAAGGQLAGLSWRWLATLLAAIGLVVAASIVGISLAGAGAGARAAQALITLALLPFALVGAALAWLFLTFLAEPLAALIRLIAARLRLIQPIEPPPAEAGPAAEELDGALQTIERLAAGATFLMALIPIVILVAAILLLRTRQRARAGGDEERESLGVLASLAADVRDLLAHVPNPFARRLAGLQAALASLRGDDPTTRVRRAYIGLLLLLEGRERPRPAALTPAEFAPGAAAAAGAPEPVAALTAAYEQARYSPAGAEAGDAEAAEAALRSLQERP